MNQRQIASTILIPDLLTSIFMSLSWWTTWPLTSMIHRTLSLFNSPRFLYKCVISDTQVTSHWLIRLERFPACSAHIYAATTEEHGFKYATSLKGRGPGMHRFLEQMPYVVVSSSAHCKALHFNRGFCEGWKCSGSRAELFPLLLELRLSRK